MKTNIKTKLAPVFTHEGGKAQRVNPIKELKRTVGTCMLFENTFYEKGSDIADRIIELCKKVPANELYNIAVDARTNLKLRHVPLFLAIQFIANNPKNPAGRKLIADVIQRPDEMGEMVSIYWKDGKKPLPAQMKKGLASCFSKFNAFKLAKWDSANDAVRIRDVMFLTHPKPVDPASEETFKQIANQSLPIPVTWETELSAGKDKKATWETLMSEKKLGVMAFLMNLRNMDKAGVAHSLISSSFEAVDKKWALPFRYITASRHAPWFAKDLDHGLMESIKALEALEGTTFIVVDTSGSMTSNISGKSEVSRIDAASSLAAVVKGIVKNSRVFWFCDRWGELPNNLEGLALVDKLAHCPSGGTMIKATVEGIFKKIGVPDRMIVVTDEQSWDGMAALPAKTKGYIINVAPYQYGVENHGGWIGINGFSERIIDWIRFEEELSK